MHFTKNDLLPGFAYRYDRENWNFNKDMEYDSICPIPFRILTIDAAGNAFICTCNAWLPISIGNILDYDDLSDLFHNDVARHLRSSIIDGSYRYCNVDVCGYKDRPNNNTRSVTPLIKKIVISLDESCNLSCPSCRNKMIFYNKGADYEHRLLISKHMNRLLSSYEHPVEFMLAGDGEIFASHVYGIFLENLHVKPSSKISLQTNGVLMKQNWKIIKYIEDHIVQVKVTMDAATESTYSKVRRGGSWVRLLENIVWLKNHKPNIELILKMVVQADNYHEIVDFVTLGDELKADIIDFTAVNDWGAWNDFDKHAVWKPSHYKHQELIRFLNEIKNRDKVQLDKILENICTNIA